MTNSKQIVSIGIDEVGRGAIAGPLVAAAVCLPQNSKFAELFDRKDSKMLSPKTRTELQKIIVSECAWSVSEVSVQEIIQLKMTAANKLAITRAAASICVNFAEALVDGNMKFEDKRFISIVNGDRNNSAICAASIVAKVYRDSLMKLMCEEVPMYGFAQNKGYGTSYHLQAIAKYGPSEKYHRTSFKNFISS